MRRVMAFLGAGLGLLASVATAQQPAASPPPEQHVRGVIVGFEGDALKVKSPGGKALTLKLADTTRVALASKAGLGSIGQGGFIGTTAVPLADGSLRAVEVHVFPEAMRGAGEGHRPWDLKPGSTMTNATVSAVEAAKGQPPSTMTNATVAKMAKAGSGLKLVLKYPAGEKTVFVSPTTPVVKLEPGDRSRLKPGAHVFAAYTRQPDGALLVLRVVVGEKGVRPPM